MAAVHDESDDRPLPCPMCGANTDSLKKHEFPRVTFYLFGAAYRIEEVTACPYCLRRHLAMWGVISLVTTNLMWPLVVLPLLLTRFIASFLPGHRLAPKSVPKKAIGGAVVVGLAFAAMATALGGLAVYTSPEASDAFGRSLFHYGSMFLLTFAFIGAYVDV